MKKIVSWDKQIWVVDTETKKIFRTDKVEMKQKTDFKINIKKPARIPFSSLCIDKYPIREENGVITFSDGDKFYKIVDNEVVEYKKCVQAYVYTKKMK